jgi:hypothetical protein
MATAAQPKVVISGEDRTKAAFASAKRGIGELAKGTDALGLSLGRIGQVAGAAGGLGSLAALGGGATIGGMVALAKSVAATGDELAKMSQRTGVSVETLGELKYVADLSDSSLEGLATGFRELSKRMADAAAGGKESTAAFRAIGVDVKNADGSLRSVDDVLLEVSDRFSSYADGAAKSALANKLFGKSGTDLIPVLNQGSRAIAQQREEARQYGVVSTQLAKQSEQFNDNLTRLSKLAEGAAIGIGNKLIPTLNDFLEDLVSGMRIFDGFLPALAALGSTNPFKDAGGNLKATRQEIVLIGKELDAIRAAASKGGLFGDANDRTAKMLEDRLRMLRGREQFLRERQARDAVRDSDGLDEPRFRRLLTSGPDQAPVVGGDDNEKAPKQSAADRYLESLKLQLQATRDLSIADKLLADIQAGRLGKVSKQQEADLLGVALQIDAANALKKSEEERTKRLEEEARLREQTAALSERSIGALVQETEAMVSANRSLAEEIELIGKTAKERAALEQLRLKDAIATKEQALAMAQNAGASQAEIRALEQQIALLKQQSDLLGQRGVAQALEEDALRAKEFADQVGASFSSAFENAVAEGEKLSDVLKGIYKDLLRLIIRNQITGPAAQAIGSFDWGSLFGGFRANGGSVSRGKFYEVNERGPELLSVGNRSYLMMGNQSGSVSPAGQASAGTPQVNIEVVNNTGVQASARQETSPDGSIRLILDAVAGDIQAGGRVAGAMSSTFGLNRGAGTPRRTR